MSSNKRPLEEEFDFVKKVEDFIDKYYALDYVIDPKARSIPYTVNNVKSNLAYHLSMHISTYMQRKSGPFRLTDARNAMVMINAAFGNSVVKEGEGLVRKVAEYGERASTLEEENRQLKDENDKLKENNLKLEEENKALVETIQRVTGTPP